MAPKFDEKWSKIHPRGAQGRFILGFYGFWAVSKNRCFFDDVLGRPKIEKIEPWSAKGLEKSLRGFVGEGVLRLSGPRGGLARGQGLKETRKQGTRNGKAGSVTPWADGPANLDLHAKVFGFTC